MVLHLCRCSAALCVFTVFRLFSMQTCQRRHFIAFLVLLSLLDYTTHTLHSESTRRASVLDMSEIIRHSVVYLLFVIFRLGSMSVPQCKWASCAEIS